MPELFANEKKKVTIGAGSITFEVLLWVFFIVPGIIFTIIKNNAKKYLNELKTQIDDLYSFINSVLDHRIDKLNKINSFAKCSFSEISKDLPINEKGSLIEKASQEANKLVDEHPDIKELVEVNKNLKKELISLKETYNTLVFNWNKEIFLWPANRIVAAKEGYTTELTYNVLDEIKVRAKGGRLD